MDWSRHFQRKGQIVFYTLRASLFQLLNCVVHKSSHRQNVCSETEFHVIFHVMKYFAFDFYSTI